ncbi:hypothetical protein EDD40_0267 [Saccharothrix texasensis]|uniref:Uncharacterized protein n=1 Tax=Saccharothrix texasensis TaxID=103734 RepID=A0A3N1GXQ5_9PSEU|nr:hypothetical protein EDD40_0267 [Saccharothrix texasensis]
MAQGGAAQRCDRSIRSSGTQAPTRRRNTPPKVTSARWGSAQNRFQERLERMPAPRHRTTLHAVRAQGGQGDADQPTPGPCHRRPRGAWMIAEQRGCHPCRGPALNGPRPGSRCGTRQAHMPGRRCQGSVTAHVERCVAGARDRSIPFGEVAGAVTSRLARSCRSDSGDQFRGAHRTLSPLVVRWRGDPVGCRATAGCRPPPAPRTATSSPPRATAIPRSAAAGPSSTPSPITTALAPSSAPPPTFWAAR